MSDLIGDDPAAEFLQQEEDQLRELGIDENQFNEPADNNQVDLMDEFQDDLTPQEPMMNEFEDTAPTVIASQPITPLEEPESIKKWREEKAHTLRQQEEEEIEAVEQLKEKAKKEMEDWYNRHNEQLEKIRNENQAAQDEFIADMLDTKPGNEWEKAARFCDFNTKFSKNTKDVSRMRGLLLQLKQTPLVR